MKPSDFPADRKFLDPTTPPYLETKDGYAAAHLFSYADVKRVQVNAEGAFSQNARAFLPPGNEHLAFFFMWATDPGPAGRHDVLRGLVEDWFHRRAVRAMADRIRGYARDLRREIVKKGTGEFNLATEFAYRMSLQTICGLVGMPLEREDWLRQELEFVARLSPDSSEFSIRHNVESFFWEMVAKRLAHPQDELLDRIINGWTKEAISDRELLGFIWGFASAGTDTTGTAIVNAFALPAEFGLLDYLRDHLDDDQALALATEEVLRFATPFPDAFHAFTTRTVTFGELEIPPHISIHMHLSAANRGPEINGRNSAARSPNEFDLTRSPNHHMSFGVGPHHCLGAALARLEIVTAWRELLTYLPDLELDESKPFVRYPGLVHGVSEAHFRFDQRRAEQLLDA